jgi:hypothetical protein
MTSYKVAAAAVPFANDMMAALTAHQTITTNVINSFIVVCAVFFMLMATPALIYFKLLDHAPKIEAERRATVNKPKWSLAYLTPRLPAAMVYGIIIWLFLVSSHGLVFDTHDIIFTASRVFEVYLPVFIEVALAVLVGDILEKRKAFSDLVWANMAETNKRIDAELLNYSTDPRFLEMLYRSMREFFLQLERPDPEQRRRFTKPNIGLENDPSLDKILVAEYRRLTGGKNFSSMVLAPVDAPLQIVAETRRVPPNGSKAWTVEALTFDLRQRGLTAAYGEAQLAKDYEDGYKARAAWRAGAKNFNNG